MTPGAETREWQHRVNPGREHQVQWAGGVLKQFGDQTLRGLVAYDVIIIQHQKKRNIDLIQFINQAVSHY